MLQSGRPEWQPILWYCGLNFVVIEFSDRNISCFPNWNSDDIWFGCILLTDKYQKFYGHLIFWSQSLVATQAFLTGTTWIPWSFDFLIKLLVTMKSGFPNWNSDDILWIILPPWPYRSGIFIWDKPWLGIQFSLAVPSFMYLLATKFMVQRSRASGQSSGFLGWEQGWHLIFLSVQNSQIRSIFQPFLFLCLFVN